MYVPHLLCLLITHRIECTNHLPLSIDEMVGPDTLAVVRPTWVYLVDFFCSGISCTVGSYLCFISFL